MKKPFLIAIAMIVLVALWMLSGVIGDDPKVEPVHAQKTDNDAVSSASEIRVKTYHAETYIPKTQINGRTQASRNVVLRAEVEGRIVKLEADEGDTLKAQQVVARLDVRDRRERVSEAEQRLNQANVEFEAAQSLQSEGFNSRIRLAEKKAERETARAQLKQVKVDLANTVIHAPFDGVIAAKNIEIGDYLRVGDEIATLVDLDPIEIVGFLSEQDVVAINLGDTSEIVLGDGQALQGKITFLSPRADEQTRTFLMKVSVPNSDYKVIAGLTASLKIPRSAVSAYRVSPSVLTLDTAGRVGVKTVDDDGVIQFQPVKVLSDRSDSVWIGGLPDQIRLITVGQDYIETGKKIRLEDLNDESSGE